MTTGGASNDQFSTLFAASEVLRHVKSVKNDSAAGVDGIKKGDILRWDPDGTKLSLLLNSWYVAGVVPDCVKLSRTVLLPNSRFPFRRDHYHHYFFPF